MEQTFENGNYGTIGIENEHGEITLHHMHKGKMQYVVLDIPTALEIAQYIIDNYSQPKQ